MTNPDNALGTNGAFGGRTSVNAFNDVLATFASAGIVSGFAVEPDSGMTVAVGGSGTVRDVAVAEDPFGNRTTVDNISGDPIPVTISTASTTSARIDSIVAYVNSPANASDTSVDNPTACGIIAVNGTSGGAPLDAAIRTAITTDGGTGSTAYYVVIANVSVPQNTTTITSGMITAGTNVNLDENKAGTAVATTTTNGLMSAADKALLDSIPISTTQTTITANNLSGALNAILDQLDAENRAVGDIWSFAGAWAGYTAYWGTAFRHNAARVCATVYFQNHYNNYSIFSISHDGGGYNKRGITSAAIS